MTRYLTPGYTLALAALLLLAACNTPSESPRRPAEESSYRNLSPDVAYVGREACKPCHEERYNEYLQSQMGRSFKPARLSLSAANFENPAPLYDRINDFYYQPFHRGEDLFVMEYRLVGRDTTYKRIEQIDYIVGSGQHTNSHIMEENGYLTQMPLTWYVQDGRWDLPPAFDQGRNQRFSRPITLECMTCHNGRPEYVAGSYNRYTHVPDGIGCEQCHGPGALHIEEILAGKIVDTAKEPDYTIVNPGRLPVDRQFDLCQRCHLQGTAVPKEEGSFLDFRPGKRLSDYVNVYLPRSTDSLSSFIMASHPDRLRMSACFIETQKPGGATPTMTCITCHNPHIDIKSVGIDEFKADCQTCHTPERGNLCTEDAAIRAQNNDNCITCHMPPSGSVDIPHIRITDHYIRKPEKLTVAEAEAQTAFIRLASRTQENPAPKEMADGYLSYFEQFNNDVRFLDSAAVYMKKAEQVYLSTQLFRSKVRLHFLEQNYPAVAALAQREGGPLLFGEAGNEASRDPWTYYRIGEAFFQLQRNRDALRFFARAVELAPEQIDFVNKLATVYVGDQQLDAAIALMSQAIQANPKVADTYNNRGYAFAMQGNFERAEGDFKQAWSLDPDGPLILANLASLYLNLNQKEKGRPFARRLVELEPENANYRSLLTMLR